MSGDQSNDRFRSATEFPKTLEQLSSAEASQLYTEMRDCLIFTNRSRSQLIRRNEEHKHSVINLRSDVVRLQGLIHQLTLEKQAVLSDRQAVISELEHELKTMTTHLDQLSSAFEDVKDINGAMGAMAIPGRFAKFWQALKVLVGWWREEYSEEPLVNPPKRIVPTQQTALQEEANRRENPQMYSDPASIQRSERNW